MRFSTIYKRFHEAWSHTFNSLYEIPLYNRVKQVVDDVWVTCPDYPDDYNPRALWLSSETTNIERTVENIARCIDTYPDVDWLIPIQGHYRKPRSILRSIKLLDELGVLKRYEYVAVANLCTERRHDIMVKTVNLAHLLLPCKRLHVFGLDLDVAMKLRGKIFSFDSMAWTFPRKPGRWSCKNQAERIQYFQEYIQKVRRDGS